MENTANNAIFKNTTLISKQMIGEMMKSKPYGNRHTGVIALTVSSGIIILPLVISAVSARRPIGPSLIIMLLIFLFFFIIILAIVLYAERKPARKFYTSSRSLFPAGYISYTFGDKSFGIDGGRQLFYSQITSFRRTQNYFWIYSGVSVLSCDARGFTMGNPNEFADFIMSRIQQYQMPTFL